MEILSQEMPRSRVRSNLAFFDSHTLPSQPLATTQLYKATRDVRD